MTTGGIRIFRKPRLTAEEEQKIRRLALEFAVPMTALATRFNTSRENVRRILREK